MIFRTVTGVGKIEEIKRKFNFVIGINVDDPDALNVVIVRQRIIVAGEASSV